MCIRDRVNTVTRYANCVARYRNRITRYRNRITRYRNCITRYRNRIVYQNEFVRVKLQYHHNIEEVKAPTVIIHL